MEPKELYIVTRQMGDRTIYNVFEHMESVMTYTRRGKCVVYPVELGKGYVMQPPQPDLTPDDLLPKRRS